MSTQNLTTVNEQTLTEYGWTRSQLDIVKNLYCKGCKDEEVKVFAHICKHTKLDPFLKQIYAIPRGGKMTVQTSIDGYRLIAERTGKYAPGKETTFLEKNSVLISATAYVKKMTTDGTWHEVAATAYFEEFRGDNLWKKMPHVMLAKCAEAQALRRAFPAELSAIYTKEELDQSGETIEINSINQETEEPKEVKISQEEYDDLMEKLALTTEKYRENFPINVWNYYKVSDYHLLTAENLKMLMKSIKTNIESQKNSSEECDV